MVSGIDPTIAGKGRAGPIRLLLVEDDAMLSSRLASYLVSQGFDAVIAYTLSDARALLKQHHFDVIVLDLNLGTEDGLELLREVAVARVPPVVITSSRGEESDRVVGIELGAADYLVKPYSFRELVARLRGVLRRQLEPRRRVRTREVVRFDRWTIDLQSHVGVDAAGGRVEFTVGELTLLRAFFDHPQRVLTRPELLALTRVDDATVFERVIDVLVTRLRQKLEAHPRRPQIIRTARGDGYRFEPEITWDVAE